MAHQTVLILDFGSQYTQLIARRLREQRVYCEILPCTAPAPRPESRPEVIGLVLSGGPSSVYDADAPPFDPAWLSWPVPVLGVCYGMQLLAHHLGGEVRPAPAREYGAATLSRSAAGDSAAGDSAADPLLTGLPDPLPVWMSHGDQVSRLPDGFRALLSSPTCPVAAFSRPPATGGADAGAGSGAGAWRWGIQFHPEVVHTPDGPRLLSNFLDACGAARDWSMGGFIGEEIARVRAKVGQDRVICALSGGVDSAVTAALLHRAIGDQLVCVFVDNGLLRAGEREEVAQDFSHYNLRVIDASALFLERLEGITDPERKRRVIGAAFIEVFEQVAREEAGAGGAIRWLAQGTLYPDVIESVSFRGPSATIKSHHNVGGLPERMAMSLIEPLRELFKDEVRALGRELGMPARRIDRKPFPGPGLAVRCPGAITAARLEALRAADRIVDEELRDLPIYRDIWQSFAVLLPVRSVGVMGDNRTYEEVCSIRAVHSLDGMTATVADIPMAVLTRISTRIINEVRGINRVMYDVSTKPPATIEWE